MNQIILYNYRANTWCFTIQNYDDEIEQYLYEVFQKLMLKYMIYGREIAPTTGTKHLLILQEVKFVSGLT